MKATSLFILLAASLVLLGCTTIEENQYVTEPILSPTNGTPSIADIDFSRKRLKENLEFFFGENLIKFDGDSTAISIPNGAYMLDYQDQRPEYLIEYKGKYKETEIVFDELIGCKILKEYSRNMGTAKVTVQIELMNGDTGPILRLEGIPLSEKLDFPRLNEICSDFIVLSESLKEIAILTEKKIIMLQQQDA